jgi:hypothetical protein
VSKKKRRPPNYWTESRIIAAMHRWKREHGKLPKNDEWANAGSYWPSQTTVYRVFPSWVKAVEMAKMDVKVERKPAVDPTETLIGQIAVLSKAVEIQMAALSKSIKRIESMLEAPAPVGNGHSHEPNLIARILGKAA